MPDSHLEKRNFFLMQATINGLISGLNDIKKMLQGFANAAASYCRVHQCHCPLVSRDLAKAAHSLSPSPLNQHSIAAIIDLEDLMLEAICCSFKAEEELFDRNSIVLPCHTERHSTSADPVKTVVVSSN